MAVPGPRESNHTGAIEVVIDPSKPAERPLANMEKTVGWLLGSSPSRPSRSNLRTEDPKGDLRVALRCVCRQNRPGPPVRGRQVTIYRIRTHDLDEPPGVERTPNW
jgi:hypothetical protein